MTVDRVIFQEPTCSLSTLTAAEISLVHLTERFY